MGSSAADSRRPRAGCARRCAPALAASQPSGALTGIALPVVKRRHAVSHTTDVSAGRGFSRVDPAPRESPVPASRRAHVGANTRHCSASLVRLDLVLPLRCVHRLGSAVMSHPAAFGGSADRGSARCLHDLQQSRRSRCDPDQGSATRSAAARAGVPSEIDCTAGWWIAGRSWRWHRAPSRYGG